MPVPFTAPNPARSDKRIQEGPSIANLPHVRPAQAASPTTLPSGEFRGQRPGATCGVPTKPAFVSFFRAFRAFGLSFKPGAHSPWSRTFRGPSRHRDSDCHQSFAMRVSEEPRRPRPPANTPGGSRHLPLKTTERPHAGCCAHPRSKCERKVKGRSER